MPFDLAKRNRKPEDPKKLLRARLIEEIAKILSRDPDERELALVDRTLQDWEPPK
ncbi:hypothetical protein [Ruegeria arenilitoris]|uniref:hypothetical protein n=1 Tax=Ruegeria arenilitoris TaxID=1173585 RepID=UPI001479D252|nr:hypothetical protein [Ruegeria arenilitoris]